MTSVNIALTVSGCMDISAVGRDRVRKRPLYRGQIIDCKNARVSPTTTVKAGDRLAEVTVKEVLTVPLMLVF